MRITAGIITLNEEEHLPRALESLSGLVDEIVVVDSGSRDSTESIARAAGARWVHQDWLGYVGQKNRVLGLASHPWVLSLDADEALSDRLRGEMDSLRRAGEPGADIAGFSMPRCVWYEGRWIRHGDWYPDRLVRLFRKGGGRFAGGRVHERLELEGKIQKLWGDIHHFSFRDAADHRARGERYARLWAESAWEQGRRVGPLAPVLHAGYRWLRCYLLRRGFLDGWQGWRIAALSSRETALKYRLLREKLRKNPCPPKSMN